MDQRELWKPDGAAIVRARQARGWSRFELAAQAGVSPHTVARAERGVALFPSTLRILAAALEMEPDELCSRRVVADAVDEATSKRMERVREVFRGLDNSYTARDPELVRRTLDQTCHEDLVYSVCTTDKHRIRGTFVGISALVGHVRNCMPTIRRDLPYQIDEIRPLGNQQILVTGVDRVWDDVLKAMLISTNVNLFTFRGDRIVSIHLSAQLLNRDAQSIPALSPATG